MYIYGLSKQETLQALSAEFGKPVIEIGLARPPMMESTGGLPFPMQLRQLDFHIDLTFAAIKDRVSSRDVILLSSPRLSFEILRTAFNSTIGSSHLLDSMSEEALLKVLFSSAPATELEASLRRRLIKKVKTHPFFAASSSEEARREAVDNFIFEINEIEKLRKKLETLGYEVVELPDLIEGKRLVNDRSVPFVNYVNAVFSGEFAFVPKTGIPIFDDYAFKAYRKLGYTVQPSDAAQLSFDYMGGPRCCLETVRKPQQNR